MDRNDQQAIDRLFEKLAAVESQGAPRDAEAERFIQERVAAQPGAPYYMAQTIVVQEQALNAAQARVEDLERQASQGGGGLLGGLLGGSQPPRRTGSVPSVGGRGLTGGGMAGGLAGRQPYRASGGGFLAGAAQTAMGVAGGVLLGSAIAGMFADNEAVAGEAGAEDAAAGSDDLGGGDMGGDFGDMGF